MRRWGLPRYASLECDHWKICILVHFGVKYTFLGFRGVLVRLNAPKKQRKDQVAADVSTHLTRRLCRDTLQGDSR